MTQSVEEFLAQGGKIQQIETGKRTLKAGKLCAALEGKAGHVSADAIALAAFETKALVQRAVDKTKPIQE